MEKQKTRNKLGGVLKMGELEVRFPPRRDSTSKSSSLIRYLKIFLFGILALGFWARLNRGKDDKNLQDTKTDLTIPSATNTPHPTATLSPVVTPASVSLTPEVTPTSVSSTTIATPVLDNCSFEEGSEIAMQDNFNIKTPEKSVSTLSTLYLGVAFGGGLFLFVLLGILIYRKFYHKHETKKSLHRVIACRDAKPDSSLQFRKGDILEVLEEQKEGVLLCYIAGNPEQQGRVREKFINRVIEIETFPRNVCVVESYEAANNELSIIKGDYLTVTGVGANGNWLMCHAYQSKPEEQTKQACVPKSSVLAIDLKNKYGLMDKDKLKVWQQEEQQKKLKEINSKLAQERQQREKKERALEAKKLELAQERKQKKEKKKALEAKKSELVQERQQKEDKERELEAKNSELVQERKQKKEKEIALKAKRSELVQERQQREEKERALEAKKRALEAKKLELVQERQQRKEKERKLEIVKSKLETAKSALLPIIPSNTLHKEERPLAKGGYGFVYRGKWLGATVALKELMNSELTDDAIKEFKKEALKMAHLRSPYVVTIYGITLNAEKRLKGIVMEYMPQGSLDTILSNREIALSWFVRCKMAFAVAQGLFSLHQQNIIHNDLKSANVLVRHYGDEWELKLTDFGVSKIKQETARFTNTSQGTPAWMAPELFDKKSCSKASDVYAYGIVLWEIVSRKRPFEGLSLGQIVTEVFVKKERPPISPEAPSSLVALMSSCWKQNREERPIIERVITKLEAPPMKQELREFDNRDTAGGKPQNQTIDTKTFPQWSM